jgi:hypothetical protein
MSGKFDYTPFRKALELETGFRMGKNRPRAERDQSRKAFKEAKVHAKSLSRDFRRVLSTLIREARPGVRNIAVGYHVLGTDIHEWLNPGVYFQQHSHGHETTTFFDRFPEAEILRELGLSCKVALVMHHGAICWAVFTSIPY